MNFIPSVCIRNFDYVCFSKEFCFSLFLLRENIFGIVLQEKIFFLELRFRETEYNELLRIQVVRSYHIVVDYQGARDTRNQGTRVLSGFFLMQ